MSIKDRLKEMLKNAMKEKDQIRLDTVKMLIAEIKKAEVEGETRRELDDAGVIEVISKYGKRLRDALEQFKQASREDLAAKVERELSVVREFLPEELSETELEKIITEEVEKLSLSGPREIGRLMASLMPQLKGRADGKLVNKLAMKVLTEKGQKK